jgi:hypothetical protein
MQDPVAEPFAVFPSGPIPAVLSRRSARVVALDLQHQDQEREEMMTRDEKTAFAQGVEEGFVRAAELSGDPEAILRQFRNVEPKFTRSLPTPRNSTRSHTFGKLRNRTGESK